VLHFIRPLVFFSLAGKECNILNDVMYDAIVLTKCIDAYVYNVVPMLLCYFSQF